MVKESYFWAVLLTIIFAILSERSSGTFSTIRDYIMSNPDSETIGVVVRSDLENAGRFGAIHFKFKYAYKVNNKEYIGSQISYGSDISLPNEMQKKYPLGMEVTVYYDSSKPQYSTLIKTTIGLNIYGHIFLLIATFILWLYLFKKLDER